MKARPPMRIGRPLSPILAFSGKAALRRPIAPIGLFWPRPLRAPSATAPRLNYSPSWTVKLDLTVNSAFGWVESRSAQPARADEPARLGSLPPRMAWRAVHTVERHAARLRRAIRSVATREPRAGHEPQPRTVHHFWPIRDNVMPRDRAVQSPTAPLPASRATASASPSSIVRERTNVQSLWRMSAPRSVIDRPGPAAPGRERRIERTIRERVHHHWPHTPSPGGAWSRAIPAMRLDPRSPARSRVTERSATHLVFSRTHAIVERAPAPRRRAPAPELHWPKAMQSPGASPMPGAPLADVASPIASGAGPAAAKPRAYPISAAPPALPDVNGLVDEVMRRLDRQLRSERLRRGI